LSNARNNRPPFWLKLYTVFVLACGIIALLRIIRSMVYPGVVLQPFDYTFIAITHFAGALLGVIQLRRMNKREKQEKND
jgi:hypothetical protein